MTVVVAEFVLMFLVKLILSMYASNPVSTTIHPLAVEPVTNSHRMMDAFTPSINVAVITWTSVVSACTQETESDNKLERQANRYYIIIIVGMG